MIKGSTTLIILQQYLIKHEYIFDVINIFDVYYPETSYTHWWSFFVGGGRREGNVFYPLISSFLDFVPHPQVKNEKKPSVLFYQTLIYWKLRTIEHILER